MLVALLLSMKTQVFGGILLALVRILPCQRLFLRHNNNYSMTEVLVV